MNSVAGTGGFTEEQHFYARRVPEAWSSAMATIRGRSARQIMTSMSRVSEE
jgi:hypothetical protein